MTCPRLAFLIGGSDAYEAMADEFVSAAGGPAARIALLLQEGERLAQRLQHYTEWCHGFSRLWIIPLPLHAPARGGPRPRCGHARAE